MNAMQRLSEWVNSYKAGHWEGDVTPDDLLAEFSNAKTASVDADGSLYIADPMTGHYLDDEAAARFVAWLEERKAI